MPSRKVVKQSPKPVSKSRRQSPIRDDRWTRLSLFFYRNWAGILLFWLAAIIGSVYVYVNLIPKEGFPSINPPSVIVTANYFVDDAAVVDDRLTQPLMQTIGQLEEIEYIQSNSHGNGFGAFVSLKLGSDQEAAVTTIKQLIDDQSASWPSGVEFKVETVKVTKYLEKYDVLLNVYDRRQQSSLADLQLTASHIAEHLQTLEPDRLQAVEVVELLVTNPQTGTDQQISYNQLGLATDEGAGQPAFNFYQAVPIGIVRNAEQLDDLALVELLNRHLTVINQAQDDFQVKIVADLATAVERNLDSLQENLLTGLVIISILSFILISWRASVIIALFMVSVLAVTILGLYFIGYSLNIITLFALILALGLLVDDAVIMVEALDIYKQQGLKNPMVIRLALKRILLASLAGTLTTILVFIPLAFVTDLLGDFIRYIPLTLTVVLLTSFLFSITLIPALSRLTILRERQQDWFKRYNPILKLEQKVANGLAGIPLLLKTKPKTGRYVMILLLLVAGSAIFYSLSLFTAGRVDVNIFPAVKENPTVFYNVTFPDHYDLARAEVEAQRISQLTAETLQPDLLQSNYITWTMPNQRTLTAVLELQPLGKRQKLSSVLIEELQQAFNENLASDLEVTVHQSGPGPDGSDYPFALGIQANNDLAATSLAQSVRDYLQSPEMPALVEASGREYKIANVRLDDNQAVITRLDDDLVIKVRARYDSNVVPPVITDQTRAAILEKFDADYLKAQGYAADIFDVRDTTPNFENSFNSLGYIFLLAIILIYILLSWQFKSLLQPLLLFTALPFAVVGVANWLVISQTPFSFIIGVGFVTLLGIVINNTILLTTYANEARKTQDRVTAISSAVKERFRPLILTTLTTILALTPLALNDYFWQNLALAIIWGLLSSTTLVLLIFPYFYLLFAQFSKAKKTKQSPDDPSPSP